VVHPPHVALVTRAQVKTDHKAVLALAQLHAAGLLTGVWMPPEIRDLRARCAQRQKLVRMQTQAKNRFQSVLHRRHTLPSEGNLYDEKQAAWWQALPLTPLSRSRSNRSLPRCASCRSSWRSCSRRSRRLLQPILACHC
jgi:hypothetical protein